MQPRSKNPQDRNSHQELFSGFAGASPGVLDCLAANLHQALNTLRAMESYSGWKN
jgi:hypothetical protein